MLNRSVRRLLPFLILLASLGLGFRAEAHLPKRSFTASNLIVRNGDTTNAQALEYDAENRLVRFSEVGRTAVEYGYAAGGQRLWRRSYVTSTNSPKLQLWIGQHYEEKDGKELFHVFAGGQRVCTFERDSILNGGSGTSTNYVGYYYHQDHLGSSSVLSDYAGSLKELGVWYPFGRTQTNNPTAAFKISNRFTGQIQDEETGLYYYNARYYDPELGRFIQADTIIPDLSNPQSFNRYTYVLNNPLKYTDPTGHSSFFQIFSLRMQFATGQHTPQSEALATVGIMADANATVSRPVVAAGQVGAGVILLAAPEPTATTKVGGGLLIADGLDKLSSSRSGNPTVFRQGLEAVYGANNPYLDTAEQIKDLGLAPLAIAAWGSGGNSAVGRNAPPAKPLETAATAAPGLRTAEQAGITAAEAQQIQNAANRLGKPINVVGSRAKGTAGVNSDWDYVVTGANRSDFNKIKNSLPGAPNRLDGTPRNLEVFKNELKPELPHVRFEPQAP